VQPDDLYRMLAHHLAGMDAPPGEEVAPPAGSAMPAPGAAVPAAAAHIAPSSASATRATALLPAIPAADPPCLPPADVPMAWDVLARLTKNNPAKMRKFALRFLETSGTGLEEADRVLASGDLAALAAAAHKLKSPARAVGALPFGALCQALEQAAEQGHAEAAHEYVGALHQGHAALRRLIETWSGAAADEAVAPS
jgi:HPt (histidine-containing phosphotransfer) domain-containing protein